VEADPQALVAAVIALVREQIGPVAAFKQACVVSRLPKTRSGKILRGTMRKIADSEAYRTPPTIEDPDSLNEIRVALETLGYAKNT
jgi:propionyl-CoA synthetase